MSDEQNFEAEQQEPERPEWLPENFNSPEDLANAFKETKSSLTQTQQQLRQQQEEFEAYLGQQEQAQLDAQQQQFVPQYQDQLREAYEQDPLAVMAWMVDQGNKRSSAPDPVAQETQYALIADAAERQLEAKYTDWEEYAPKVAERIQARGDIYPEALFRTPASTAQVLEEVYKTVKFDDLASGAAIAQDQQGLDARGQKIQAQTLTGAGSRPDAPNDDEDFFNRLKQAHNQSYSAFRGA